MQPSGDSSPFLRSVREVIRKRYFSIRPEKAKWRPSCRTSPWRGR